MNDAIVKLVLLGQLASTLYMTGLIWFVQIVHYPLMNATGSVEFPNYETRHTALTTWVVGPPMLLEIATSILFLTFRPTGISSSYAWAGLFLIAIIWLSTALLQVPCHNGLTKAFDAVLHERLVMSNWIRTIAWSIRSGLLLTILWKIISSK